MADYLPILIFYGCAAAIIYLIYFSVTKDFLKSVTSAFLIVFVSSEFWEIPLFFFAYLGLIGSFPEWTNHLIVGVMAFLLVSVNGLKLDKINAVLLIGDLLLNFIFMVAYPLIYGNYSYSIHVNGWILRAISLTTLTAVFLRSRK